MYSMVNAAFCEGAAGCVKALRGRSAHGARMVSLEHGELAVTGRKR